MANEVREKCRHWDSCSAPLCLLDSDSLENGIWYPDEEVCRKRQVPEWIKRQKKITRKARDYSKNFLLEMVKQNCVVGKGMTELDPDSLTSENEQLKRWYRKHPLLSTATRKKRAEIGQRALKRLQTIGS